MQQLETFAVCKDPPYKIRANIEHATKLGLPPLTPVFPPIDKSMVIVGGGPTIKEQEMIDEIDRLSQDERFDVFALNKVPVHLAEHGITPRVHVLLDADPDCIDYLSAASKDTIYFISSQCDPCIFEALKDHNVVIWNSFNDTGILEELGLPFVGGPGTTVGLRSLSLGYQLGYRRFELYGYDSCLIEDDHYAYDDKIEGAAEAILNVMVAGRTWKCNVNHLMQKDDFVRHLHIFHDCKIRFHGDGLLRHVHNTMMAKVRMLEAEQAVA